MRGGAEFVLRASRTSPSPSASVDRAHLRPFRGRIGRATRNKSDDLVRLTGVKSLPSDDNQFFIHDADSDNLLVEVDADKVHCKAPSLGETVDRGNSSSLPQAQRFCKTVASTSLS